MISIAEERVRLNPKQPDKINIQDNALIVDNTVYQISNISYAKVRKWKKVEHKPTPVFALVAWLFLGAVLTAVAKELTTLIAGFLIFAAVIGVYASDKLQRLEYNYLLVLHFDSGYEEYLQSRNPKFLKEVVEVLQKKIENPSSTSSYVANFNETRVEMTSYNDNSVKTGNIGNVSGSLTIGYGQEVDNSITESKSPKEFEQLKKDLKKLKAELDKARGNQSSMTTEEAKTVLKFASLDKRVKDRLVNALGNGFQEAVKEVFDHPYVNVVVAVIEGWRS